MSVRLQVKETGLKQGQDEQISYSLTTTPWGSTPSDVAVTAYEGSSFTVVTDTVLSGSPSVNGDVITTPIVKSLTAGKEYRIEIKFTVGGNIMECYFELEARL